MFATTYKHFHFRSTQTITIEEVKRQYRKLAMENHPDLGGDLKTMQEINAEFDILRKRYYNVHESQSGSTYTDETQETVDEVTANFEAIIEALLKMEGVGVEICGKFIWLDGNTYAHKTEIKALGFKWASKKKKWFLAPADWRKRDRREWTMGEIRAAHGSKRVTNAKTRPALVA